MRRLLYRVMVFNLTLFMFAALALILSRQLIDPAKTPYHAIRQSLGLALDLDVPPAQLEARLHRLHDEIGSRMSIYSPEGELIASSVDPPLPYTTQDRGLFGGYHDVESESGEIVARLITEPPLTSFFRQLSRDLLSAWLAVCALTVMISVRATRRLAEPLLAVEDAARRLGEGQLDARVTLKGVGSEGVLAELAHAFNEMAGRMSLLLRSQRELIANVSHEFRTPLARMRVVSEMLAEGDDVRELLPELDTDIGELERLVSRVLESAALELEAARIRDGAAPSPARQVLVGRHLIERVANRFTLAYPARALVVELDDKLLESAVEVELDSLLRAFDNLLENARRYSDEDREITLRASLGEDALAIEIIDRGIGISAEDLALVFNPFFRADRSRARHTGGLGLGLATSRAIVEAQGGQLSVRSQLDRGSTFEIRLPLATI